MRKQIISQDFLNDYEIIVFGEVLVAGFADKPNLPTYFCKNDVIIICLIGQ